MKYLCVGESYEKDGQKKISWKRIGETFTGRNGKDYMKLYFMPGILISVFDDDKNKDSKPAKQSEQFYPELSPDESLPF